ncbi:hypothetical protein ABIC30_000003 [Methylobacterium sp. 1030]
MVISTEMERIGPADRIACHMWPIRGSCVYSLIRSRIFISPAQSAPFNKMSDIVVRRARAS